MQNHFIASRISIFIMRRLMLHFTTYETIVGASDTGQLLEITFFNLHVPYESSRAQEGVFLFECSQGLYHQCKQSHCLSTE